MHDAMSFYLHLSTIKSNLMNKLLMKFFSLTIIIAGLSPNLAASEELDFSSISKYKELRYSCPSLIGDKRDACHKEISTLFPTYKAAKTEMDKRVALMVQ